MAVTLLHPEPQTEEPVAKTVDQLWKKLGVASKEIEDKKQELTPLKTETFAYKSWVE
jgi:hypothetical protein